MEKPLFALYQYSLLAIFAGVVWGLGRPLTGWLSSLDMSGFIRVPLVLAGGMGVAMVALFIGSTAGFLTPVFVAGLILLGVGLALLPPMRRLLAADRGLAGLPRPEASWWIALAVAAGLFLLLRPLQPPVVFDELNYHLPYARSWAEQGALTVDPWLRYPLFAYNMDLLYAASLVLRNDVLTHLLHAFAGALTVALVFGVAQRHFDWRVGVLAAIGLLTATYWFWGNAYVDLGVMLFWSCAFAVLALRSERGDPRLSYLAAFFAGIAVGIKYQALFYLPVFAVLALVVERRPGVVVKSLLVFVLTGGYWYLRNFLVSGDPVHPVGGPVFGYWLWNAGDLAGQYGELGSVRDWPHWALFPAAGAALFFRDLTPVQRGILLSAAGATGLWYLVSGYSRYLLAVYPMLALLSAYVLVASADKSGIAPRLSTLFARFDPRLVRGLAVLLVLALAVQQYGRMRDEWERIAPDEESRVSYLSSRFAGYDLLLGVDPASTGTLYQLGFEGERYHLEAALGGERVRGDWFGPGRYSEVLSRRRDAAALARYLEALGADSLLVNLDPGFVGSKPWDPALGDHFALVARSDKAILYRRKQGPPVGVAATAEAGGLVP